MRPLEIILLLVITILPFVKRPLVRYIKPGYILVFLGILFTMHLLFEGWRWQMVPAYLLLAFLAWRIKVIDTAKPVRLSFLRGVGFLGLSILILLAWLLPFALPVFTLPAPQGAYTVGTELIYKQTNRDEVITEDPDDRRELMYKIWYPSQADVSSLKGERYVDEASRAGFATKYGLAPAMLDYLDYVETFVYPDIQVADDQFPVLIFSHGYGSKATGYYSLLTEIASQGYVIINMNHTFESLGVTLPDGRIKFFDYDYQSRIASGSMEKMQPLIDAFRNGQTYEQRHPVVQEAVKNYFEGRIQDRWADDMLYTLELLVEWNAEGPLKNRLDLDRIGVIGHSVGGGSVGNVAMKDERVKAAVNLDGIQWGKMIDTAYHIPYLYVSADWPAEHEDINSHVYINKSTNFFYETKLLNSGHPNFMDIPFMIPVNSVAGTGTIDPYQGMEIVTNLVTSFFDRHLKNRQEIDLQNLDDEYELLEMTIYRGDSIE